MENKKLLLKLSGEALKNGKDGIIDFDYLKDVCSKIKKLQDLGYSIGIVIGGGNIWRGRDNTYINSELSDKIGIMSTTMNSLILQATFKEVGADAEALNAFEAEGIVLKATSETISSRVHNSTIIIFGGGTGKVGCSTDTAAALRAIDMTADMLVKVTKVDGVYDSDPMTNSNAKKYDKVSFDEVIEKELKVMDIPAVELCKNNNIPIFVMNINRLDELDSMLNNCDDGTLISDNIR